MGLVLSLLSRECYATKANNWKDYESSLSMAGDALNRVN